MNSLDVMALMPLIILTAGCVLVLLAGAVRPGGYLYWSAMVVVVAALLWSVAVPIETVMPGLAVTRFSRTCSAFLYGTGLVALLLAAGYTRRRGIVGEEYPATLLFGLVGMGVVCAASDLLMLFLGLEAFTFAFYILVAVERDSGRGGEAGLKYLLNGTLSAAVMGMGMALVYVASGTLKLAELASAARTPDTLLLAGLALILLGLAFKLSLVPAHLWTADVYQGAPAPVTALLSTASKGAAVVAFLLLFPLLGGWRGFHDLLWLLALLTLLSGNLAALAQTSIKRMLAWSSIGQMGYVALAFVALPAGGGRAALFYTVAYAAAGLASFGAVTVLSENSDRDDLEEYRGLGYKNPLAGAALALAMFSLAGIPPAAGFMAKFGVFAAALRGGETVLALAGVLMALVAVFFYLRVVVVLYMKPADVLTAAERPLSLPEQLALVIPMLAMLALGVYPSPLLDLLEGLLR
ncbi:MAG: NADH-quinone oxidoreductase subunit N [Desulfuromonadales bacterium]|nr:NADH-quinone oxidoreductase subunit N [Desulfuromonadales bacterium]